ncbi:hypothetical protein CTEN210_05908 [Chaetoceros tenuissimus]|uniref:Calmodulin n=1 Tax=Chaetoceros tenuissimus TaxID=426638 RepID=A0AAD3CP24_9STRA|nr:hypothetical protein CTEN210_05908 [Chaetoceros tenuissimus]
MSTLNQLDGRISPPTYPPDDLSEHVLQNVLQPGQLVISRIHGSNIRLDHGFQKVDPQAFHPSVRFTYLCPNGPVEETSTLLDSDENPSFGDESIHFNIPDPKDLVVSNDVKLKIEVLDTQNLRKNVVGEVTISATRFFRGGQRQSETFPLQIYGKKSQASITLSFEFNLVKEGILKVSCKSMENSLTLVLGTLRTTDNIAMFPISRNNWYENLRVESSVLGQIKIIPLLPLLSKFHDVDDEEEAIVEISVPGKGENEVSAKLSIAFYQAAYIQVEKIKASLVTTLTIPNTCGLQIKLSTNRGHASKEVVCTSILRMDFPGSDVVWSDKLILPIVDHDTLEMELVSLDALGNQQDVIGKGEASLLPLYSKGQYTLSSNIATENDVGSLTETGTITLDLSFDNNDLFFPKFHPTPAKVGESLLHEGKRFPFAQNVVKKGSETSSSINRVFTDEEIKDAFSFIDLDKNGYISAQELRHVLICSGELITAEEVDAMIHILDTNGDGQVSLSQFTHMAKTENFGENKSTLSVSKTVSMDPRYEQLCELLPKFIQRTIDKNVINNVVESLELRRNTILSDGKSNVDDAFTSDYTTLCQDFCLEDTGESRTLFQLYAKDGAATIDTRDVVLGFANFALFLSTHERCSIMLRLYDTERKGVISTASLDFILAANHLKSIATVEGKVKTILKFVDKNCSGRLCLDDLIDAASKFPNLLFPKHISEKKGKTKVDF